MKRVSLVPANSLKNKANKAKYRAESPTWSILNQVKQEPRYDHNVLQKTQANTNTEQFIRLDES